MKIKMVTPKSIHARFDIDEAYNYLNKKAEKMRDMAIERAPIAKAPYIEVKGGKAIKRRPGRLKKNIKAKQKRQSIKVYLDTTQKGAPYGFYQEVGFRHYKSGKAIPGKFYFETAFDITMLEIKSERIDLGRQCIKYSTTNGRALTKIR